MGRGGQFLLASLAYPVLRSLMGRMERSSVCFPVYTSLAFDKISFITLWTTSAIVGKAMSRK